MSSNDSVRPSPLERAAAWARTALERRRGLRRLPRNIEFETPTAARRYRQRTPQAALSEDSGVAPGAQVICPRCSSRAALEPLICSACGFPFICDVEPLDRARLSRRSLSWRVLLGAAALVFWLTNVALVAAGSSEYEGQTTRVVANLSTDNVSAIPLSGPDSFVTRTQLALDLLRRRAPDFYYRMTTNITSIDYLSERQLQHGDTRISLEGIGALATPSTGQVQVLQSTAFPSGVNVLWDADIFSYCGVLVHELRHIELHRIGKAPGGWEEEVLCEEAAYEALLQMQAPGAVLARYQIYLANPQAGRYQRWYDWYNQF